MKLRDNGGYGLAIFCHVQPCSTHAPPMLFLSTHLASTTPIHGNSNYAAILSPGSPSTKWCSFRTLFCTRGFSIARETYKRLVKNRSADRFRDIGCGYTDGWIHGQTNRLFQTPLHNSPFGATIFESLSPRRRTYNSYDIML